MTVTESPFPLGQLKEITVQSMGSMMMLLVPWPAGRSDDEEGAAMKA